jgi:threonine dehydratase
MINYDSIKSSENRIRKYIYNTPLEKSLYLSSDNKQVYLKLENQQRLKTFKLRGAFSKLTSLSKKDREEGVITISSGNHGASISYSSKILGDIKSTVIVPKNTPQSKIEKIKYYGAEILLMGENYDEAHIKGLEYLKNSNQIFVDSCSDIEVICGQGTIANEILEANPDIDVIVVPIGGGGLITGVSIAAKAIKPSIKIVGVQTAACPAMVESMKDKTCYIEYPSKPSICEALIGGVGEIPFELSNYCIDDILLVEENDIKKALIELINREKVISEPSGAVSYGAIMSYPEYFENKNTAVIISGGNLDFELLKKIL